MKNIVCLAFLAGSLLAGPAFAEDKSTSHPDAQAKPMAAPPAGTAMPTATDGAGGMTMANTATVKIRFITAKPADIMSSKLVGKTLYNNKNENVGEIEDLVIDNGKTVTVSSLVSAVSSGWANGMCSSIQRRSSCIRPMDPSRRSSTPTRIL